MKIPGRFLSVLICLAWLGGCDRAQRYPAIPVEKSELPVSPAEPTPAWWSWQPPRPVPDLLLVFVSSENPEWEKLQGFWNHQPGIVGGMRTVHVGQTPLGMAAALVLADRLEVIKIKVPLGLPDPSPHIPPGNPLTFGRWRLGQELFFDQVLRKGYQKLACADCHSPHQGFSLDQRIGELNPPSLLNVVYQKRLFWDGRAGVLEETVIRSLADERPASGSLSPKDLPENQHRWGMIERLEESPYYRERFRQVFGISSPTQDAAARALAVYLRTLLSGDSLIDRAEMERKNAGDSELKADHFLPHLSADALRNLGKKDAAEVDRVARDLEQGFRLFRRTRCVDCHPGPLYTDQDFHNLGVGDSDFYSFIPGRELGRFARVPIGLKEIRLMGAYRTPSLRSMGRTYPYMHDGSFSSVGNVLEYFDHGLRGNPSLAEPFRAGPDQARKFGWNPQQKQQLLLFLRALEGTPVDPILVRPPSR